MSVNEDWQGKDTATGSNSSRIAMGVSFLVLAAIGLAIWIYWVSGREKPKPFVAAFYSGPVSQVALYEEVRTSSFVENDINQLKNLILQKSKGKENFNEKRWSGRNALVDLEQDLRDYFSDDDERNPAILYVAFNVWGNSSDEDASGTPTGPVIKLDDDTAIPLSELLEKFQNVQAETKLVLLDAGQLSHDPNRPTLRNEFLEQLDELLRNEYEDGNLQAGEDTALSLDGNEPLEDSQTSQQGKTVLFSDDLWVIVSHGKSQTSFVAEARQGSVFNWSVAAALTQLKRKAPEEDISVAQLYESICGICSEYTEVRDFDDTLKPLQTPQLMRGGTGIIRDKSKHQKDISEAIVFYKSLLNDDTDLFPSDEEKSGEESDADPAKQAEKQVAQKDAASLDSGDANNDSEMAKLWKLRDELESREIKGFSPVDVAPHLWMLFNHELVDLDHRFVGQGAKKTKDDFVNIENGLDRLIEIAKTGSDENDSRSTSGTLKNIIDAYRTSRGGKIIDDELPEDLKIDLQSYRDAYYRFVLYLDWCRRQLQSGSNEGFEKIEIMFEKLKVASNELDQTDFKPEDHEYWLDQKETILDAEKKVIEVWKNLVEKAFDEADDMTVFRRKLLLRNFLSSPLVSYNDLKTPQMDRARLRRELQKLTSSSKDKFKLDETSFADANSTITSSENISKLWDWRRELAFSGGEYDRTEPSADANSLQNKIFDQENGQWKEFVLFRPAWLAGKNNKEFLRFAMPELRYEKKETKSRIVFGNLDLDKMKMDLDNPVKDNRFNVPLRKTPQIAADPKNVKLVLEAATQRDIELAKLLSIKTLVDKKESPMKLGDELELEVQNGKFPELTLCFDVEPGKVPAQLKDPSVRLTLVLKAAELPDLKAPIVLKLPKVVKTEFSITAKGLDGEKPTKLKANQIESLQPYFNRYRSFEFSLKNDSGRPKVYNLELFAIQTDPAERLPGRLTPFNREDLQNDLGRFAKNAKTPFAVAKDLHIPKQMEKVVIWSPPGEAKSSAADAEDSGSSQLKPEGLEIDLTGGMLCRVTQQDDRELGYTNSETSTDDYWIELNELKLESLVEAKQPRFERDTGNFSVRLQPVPTLPAEPFYDGVEIDLTTDNRDVPNPDSVKLTNENKDPKLVIPLPNNLETEPTFVYLNVDGYRGIVIFEIDDTPRPQNIRAKDNYIRLRNISVAEDEIEKPYGFRAGNSWFLPSKQPTEQDPLKYSFDVLIDVQDNFEPYYRIKFDLKKKKEETLTSLAPGFLLDRKIEYKARLDESGTLQIKEEVNSHKLVWETQSKHIGPYDLVATIVDRDYQPIPKDRVNSETQFTFPIQFDDDPPLVIRSDPKRKTLYDDQSFSITVVAIDDAGIKKAELFIDANGNGKKDPDEEEVLKELHVGSEPGKEQTIPFPINDLKKYGLIPEKDTLNDKKYRLGVVLTDRFGSSSYADPFSVTVKSRKKEDDEKKKAMEQVLANTEYTVEINAFFRLNPTKNGILAPKQLTLKLDPEGESIPYLPSEKIVLKLKPDKYDLKYDGLVKSTLGGTIKVKGSFQFEVPRESTGTIKLDMELTRDEEDKSP